MKGMLNNPGRLYSQGHPRAVLNDLGGREGEKSERRGWGGIGAGN